MQIGEGPGWRLMADASRHPYSALIGAEHWAVELRRTELIALARGVGTLIEQHRQLLDTLMPEEQISLELDLEVPAEATTDIPPPAALSGSLHLALEGDGRHWALRFVLTPCDGARAVEGSWTAAASPALAAALLGLEAMAPEQPGLS